MTFNGIDNILVNQFITVNDCKGVLMEYLSVVGGSVFFIIIGISIFVFGWYVGWKFFVRKKDMWGKSPFERFIKKCGVAFSSAIFFAIVLPFLLIVLIAKIFG